METSPLHMILSLLTNVRASGEGYLASCPTHDDNDPSLSITEGSDGRVLLKCFAGCPVEEIVRSIGLTMADLFIKNSTSKHPITVADLAANKRIPESFLRSLGLTDREDGVVIPYGSQDGTAPPRNRLRTALKAKEGSLWILGKGPIAPYGLDRLPDARTAGFVIFVEGESDCWTLWHHGFPALGIPGADMTGKLEAEHLDGIARTFVVHEPGKGGDTLVRGTAKRLQKIGWQGEALVVNCGDFKDPNDLHKADPEKFKSRFESILNAASELIASTASTQDRESTCDDPIRESGLDSLGLNPPHARVEAALRKLAALLDGEDDLRKATIREAAIAKLTSCGLKAPAKLLDATLGVVKSESDHEGQGRSLILVPPTPWPESVDGAELLDEIVATFRRYVVMVEGADVAVSLWVLHAHAFEAWWLSPYLSLESPEKRCGKTTALEIVGAMSSRKLPAANISPAALFRTVEIVTPTLLIDEADAFLNRNEDLRGILNAGHTKSTASVIRTVGEDHEPRQFSTWCPKVIASIGSLTSTLNDRSIVIPMRRRSKGEVVMRLRRDRLDAEMEVVRRKAARWAADHVTELRDADPAVPSELNDRAQDNWRPLLAIADAVGGSWPVRGRKAALALNGTESGDDLSHGVRLLADIQTLFRSESADQLPSENIVKALIDIEDGPWAEYKQGRSLTVNGMASLLKPFKIKPRTIRYFGKTPKGYRLVDFEDSFQRYLGFEPQQPQQVRNDNEIDPFSNRNIDPPVAVAETPEKDRNDNVVAGVAVPEPESRGNTAIQPPLPLAAPPPVEEWEL
jgi:putative DNA primase/helicase